jgi:hypothetical protein
MYTTFGGVKRLLARMVLYQAMKLRPAMSVASTRPYQGIPDPHYPFHDRTVMVTSCGRLCLYRKKINLSVTLAGQAVGVNAG